ncbi:MAG: VOC family protein [Dehalococcoidia bacterium]
MFRSISHVALKVNDLAEAETYYCGLFDLQVAFRDLIVDGVQYSLPPGKTWADAIAKGHSPGLSALTRDGLFLAFEQSPGPPTMPDHIGFDVDAPELAAQNRRLGAHECRVVTERDDILVFVDRFGLRWELTTRVFGNPADQSTGARLGMWLELGS